MRLIETLPHAPWRHAPSLRQAVESPQEGGALSFSALPGSLLVVAGLCGGAGASTLAYLIAVSAAARSSVPVLVCDTGGPSAGLSAYADAHTAHTLSELSEQVAATQPIAGELCAVGRHGLRVIASDPQFTVAGDGEGIARVLADAREVHGLTVIDAGTLAREADRVALGVASHVAWVMPATQSALLRAPRVLTRIAPLGKPELLIARECEGHRAPLGALCDAADERRAPLVLMPTVGELAVTDVDGATERAALALQAVGGLLCR